MGIFTKDEEVEAPVNETVEKNLADAEAAKAADEEVQDQRLKDAAEVNQIEKDAKKLGGEYVRFKVSHATTFSSGSIHICGGAQQFNIRPDEEVVAPAWVPDRLKEVFHPVFDKEAKKQTNKNLYAVEVIERGLTQYHYKNFLSGKDKKKD